MRLIRELFKEAKIDQNSADILSEEGAGGSTGGGAVGAVAGRLFAGTKAVRRPMPGGKGQIPVIKFKNDSRKFREGTSLTKTMSLMEFAEKPGATNGFDPADVISKLQSAEKENDFSQKSVPFGMEDANGNTVKVYVRPEQADDFENALASMVKDSANSETEIAEILFNLKDSFDIVHVDWGTLPAEDEGEDLALADDAGAAGGEDLTAGAAGGEAPPGPEGEIPPEGEAPPEGELPPIEPEGSGDEGAVQSSLAAVIDMLKADAEARKAEADAKAKQAEAEQARYAAQIADSKMKSEVEVLDMEDWNKRKEEEKKEAKKLAGLARYRHEQASSAFNDASRAQYDKIPGAGGPVTEI
jgi:hypothetical protein